MEDEGVEAEVQGQGFVADLAVYACERRLEGLGVGFALVGVEAEGDGWVGGG